MFLNIKNPDQKVTRTPAMPGIVFSLDVTCFTELVLPNSQGIQMTSTVFYKVKFVQMKSLKFWKLYYNYFSDILSYCYCRKIIWFKLQFPEEVIKETGLSINDGFVSLHLVFGTDSVYI